MRLGLQFLREIVVCAVSNNGLALKFASSRLQGDREVVMKAVSNDGRAWNHASVDLKCDREVLLNHYHCWLPAWWTVNLCCALSVETAMTQRLVKLGIDA